MFYSIIKHGDEGVPYFSFFSDHAREHISVFFGAMGKAPKLSWTDWLIRNKQWNKNQINVWEQWIDLSS